MNWNDIEDIGIELYEKMPATDPLTVRYTDLLKWIGELDGFEDDISKSNESKLEAVQMAWYEEWKDNQK
jgi:FeS assembly protein IscX